MNKAKEKQLSGTSQTLENLLATDHNRLDDYHKAKQEWEDYQNKKLFGAMLRSKAKWVEHGEKNTKFFLNLEKKNYNSKHIKKLIQGQNTITDPVAILKEQKRYYCNLYTSRHNQYDPACHLETLFLDNPLIPKISDDERYRCDQKLTTNFYKFFWADIKDMLVDSYNYSFQKNNFHRSKN